MAAGWRNAFTQLYSKRIRRQAATGNFLRWFMSWWLEKIFFYVYWGYYEVDVPEIPDRLHSLTVKITSVRSFGIEGSFSFVESQVTNRTEKGPNIQKLFPISSWESRSVWKKGLPPPGKQEPLLWGKKRSNCVVLLFLTMGLQLKSQRSTRWPFRGSEWRVIVCIVAGWICFSLCGFLAKVFWAKIKP